MTQALYRKWRPALWDEVVGQDHIVQTLRNAVETDRVGHAYLFAGPRGTGKTTSARLLAKAVNCLHEDIASRPCNECANCVAVNQGRFLDLIEIDAASNTSVEDVRDLRDKINFSPSQGKFKIYIIDEVHMLSTSAFNALLKTLEEPPPHVIFILATTEIHKIPATVLSRCQRHEFRRIPIQTITDKLRTLCNDEGIQINDETLNLIARQSTGSLRDAISLVDQLSSMTQNISLEIAQDILGTATSQSVVNMVGAILTMDDTDGLNTIQKALDSGSDPRQYARQVVDYLRNLLLIKMGLEKKVETPADIKKTMKQHAGQFEMQRLLDAIIAFSNAASDLKASWHPGLGLEIAFASIVTRNQIEKVTTEKPELEKGIGITSKKGSKADSQKSNLPSNKPTHQEMPINTELAEKHLPVEKKENDSSIPLPGKGITFAALSENWKAVKELIRKDNPLTEALVNSGKLMGINNDIITLSFSSDLLKKRMLSENNLVLLRRALLQIFGREIKVSVTTGNQTQSKLPSDIEIDANGMVGFATSDLGGEIVDIQ